MNNLNTIKESIRLKSELDSLRPLSQDDEQRIWQKFRLDWNYHSNHIEGNALTYGETKALILFNVTASGKPLQDTIEMAGHNEAIKWIIEIVKQERPLNEQFIKQLHEILFNEPTYSKAQTSDGKTINKRITPGKYKTTPNHVKTSTGELFRFATPEETPAKMGDLMEWFRKNEGEKINPILLAAEFHYKFIRIHPFDDGNGRMARILMNFVLMKYGYPPVVIRTEDKENYYASLTLADAGNIEPFIEYIAQNLVHALKLMIAGANGENIEDEDDVDKEIALLEQELIATGSHLGEKRSTRAIKIIIELYVTKIAEEFTSQCVKLNKFYTEIDFSLIFASHTMGVGIGVDIKPLIIDNVLRFVHNENFPIELACNLKEFKIDGFEGFDSIISLKINFTKEYCMIQRFNSSNNVLDPFIKNYGEQFKDKEIKELIEGLIKQHLIELKGKSDKLKQQNRK